MEVQFPFHCFYLFIMVIRTDKPSFIDNAHASLHGALSCPIASTDYQPVPDI